MWDPTQSKRTMRLRPFKLRVPGRHHVMLSLLHMEYLHSDHPELQVTLALRSGSNVTIPARSSWPTQVLDTALVDITYNASVGINRKSKGFRLIYSFHPVRRGFINALPLLSLKLFYGAIAVTAQTWSYTRTVINTSVGTHQFTDTRP